MKQVPTVAFFLLAGGSVFGQVTAHQGVVAKQGSAEERTIFRSPMVLEVPATLFLQIPQMQNQDRPVTTQSIMEVTNYVCDAVSFQLLILHLARPNSKGEVKLTVFATLKTDPGMDKLVNLTFEVLSKGEPVAKALVTKIDAEEGKTASVKTKLTIPQAKLDLVEAPLLRITMEVRDNA
jgi:hypothetical protein